MTDTSRIEWIGNYHAARFASAVMAQSVKWGTLGVVGRASLGILVLHKFPILAIQSVPALRGVAFGNGVGVCLTVVVAVAVSVAATVVVRRFAPWTLGEHGHSRAAEVKPPLRRDDMV